LGRPQVERFWLRNTSGGELRFVGFRFRVHGSARRFVSATRARYYITRLRGGYWGFTPCRVSFGDGAGIATP
jgi:hypothetical protein